jgi:hypothetical protein
MLIAASTTAGCLEFTEQQTTTVLDRRPLPPYVRRAAALDRVVVEPAWEGEKLVVRAMTEQVSVAYEAERQTVDQATMREPVSWVPVIVHGTVAAIALGAIVATEISKSDCPTGDNVCPMLRTVFFELPAGATLIAMTALFISDVPAMVDRHERVVWDVPTGAMTTRSDKVPLSGARLTLRFQDGVEMHATTDEGGTAHVEIPHDRVAARAPAVLLLRGARMRDIEMRKPIPKDAGER